MSKKIICILNILCLMFASIAGFEPVMAMPSDLIAEWNYNSTSDNVYRTADYEFPANGGELGDYAVLFARKASTDNMESNAPISYSAGTTNCITFGTSGVNLAVGDYYQLNFSTKYFSNISINLDSRNSGTGPRNLQWQYSLTGTNGDFLNIGEPFSHIGHTTDAGPVLQANLPTLCDDADIVFVRLVIADNVSVNGGTIGSAGTWGIKNIKIAAESTGNIPTVAVTNVSLSENEGTLYATNTVQLNWEVYPFNATNKNIVWSSDDNAVALVSEGLVTAVSEGVANIKAVSAENESIYDIYTVTIKNTPEVEVAVWSYASAATLNNSLDGDTRLAASGGILQNRANLFARKNSVNNRNTNAPITYTSSVISVGDALAVGDYFQLELSTRGYSETALFLNTRNSNGGPKHLKLQYSLDGENFTDIYDYTFPNTVTSIEPLGPVKLPEACDNVSNLYLRLVIPLSMSVNGGNIGGTGTWGINGVKILGTLITGNETEIPVENVILDKTNLFMRVGDNNTLTAIVSPIYATNKKVNWSSSDNSVITAENGEITAVSAGNATVFARSDDNHSIFDVCLVRVRNVDDIAVSGITLNKQHDTLKINDTLQLTPDVIPSNATEKGVVWTSSNVSIATVSSNGLVTAKSAGTTTVKAVSVDDSSLFATCMITVESETIPGDGSMPPLLITEIVCDTATVPPLTWIPGYSGSDDLYEFLEVYNTTDEDISFNNNYIIYWSSNGIADTTLSTIDGGSEFIIPAKTAAVFWDKRTTLGISGISNQTKDDFIRYYREIVNVPVPDDVIIGVIGGKNGFTNASGGFRIYSKNSLGGKGSLVTSASYETNTSAPDSSHYYRYSAQTPNTMTKIIGTYPATPGIAYDDQVGIENAVDISVITSKYEAANTNITITVNDSSDLPSGRLYYKNEGSRWYKYTPLVRINGRLAGIIPEEFASYGAMRYFVTVGTSRSDNQVFLCINNPPPSGDYRELAITELMVKTYEDSYQYIEVLNTTNKDISFKDYRFRYRVVGISPLEDLYVDCMQNAVVKANSAAVFWLNNENKTPQEFNNYYKTNLTYGENLFVISGVTLSSVDNRSVVLATKSGHDVSVATYDGSRIGEVYYDMAQKYAFGDSDSNEMICYSAGKLPPEPGFVTAFQRTDYINSNYNDTIKPVFQFSQKVKELAYFKDYIIEIYATDDKEVKSCILYYKTVDSLGNTEEKSISIEDLVDENWFKHTIAYTEFLGKKHFEFRFELSDGINTTISPSYTVGLISPAPENGLTLSQKENDVLAGTTPVFASFNDDLTIKIDNKTIQTESVMQYTAHLVFDARHIVAGFENGIFFGGPKGTHVYTLNMETPDWQSFVVEIPREYIKKGNLTLLSFNSGDRISATNYDSSSDERDSFFIKNVRLVLNDGTAIYDSRYGISEQNVSSHNKYLLYNFNIEDEYFNSKMHIWDTTSVADGKHIISAVDKNGNQKNVNVIIDNTAPIINTTVSQGQKYKGKILLGANVHDVFSNVLYVEARLDGETIVLPKEVYARDLSPGVHTLTISVSDDAKNWYFEQNQWRWHGNEATKTVSFIVADENPLPAQRVGDANSISVTAVDPEGDDMTVSFYKGFSYNLQSTGIKAYKGAADTEPPPTLVSPGEVEFSPTEYINGAETISEMQYPYHRFEIPVDSTVADNDILNFKWTGSSIEGRKVTMYVWNSSRWESISSIIAADNNEFTLSAEVPAKGNIISNKVHLMIQDEFPPSDSYDATFAWITDTQYYSESYPYIYEFMNQWIVDNSEKYKIKYVMHTGDLVQNPSVVREWIAASNAQKILDDAGMPNGVLAGNHDVLGEEDYTMYYRYFPSSRYENFPWYGGSYLNNRGHYDIVSIKGQSFIFVYMGWGTIGNNEIAWMNDVLRNNQDKIAFLAFHGYLDTNGGKGTQARRIYENVVVPNKNVYGVFGGHNPNAITRINQIDDGDGVIRTVYEMLFNTQYAAKGGNGFMRLLHLNLGENKIYVNTYSPYIDEYDYFGRNVDRFEMTIPIRPPEKKVETSFIGINVYTKKLVDIKSNVKSGSVVTASPYNITANEGWYAYCTDNYFGYSYSDVFIYNGITSQNPSSVSPSSPLAGSKNGSVSSSGGSVPSGTFSNDIPFVSLPVQPRIANDVAGHWAEDVIYSLIDENIISGYEDGSIKPDSPITREEAAVLLVRRLKLSLSQNSASFSDINGWSLPYIQTAYEDNLINGYADNFFMPKSLLTRGEAMILIVRALKLEMFDFEKIDFSDTDEIPQWMLPYVSVAVSNGVVRGYEDNTVRVNNDVTRAEFFTLIKNLLK